MSKWETAASVPSIDLLIPLADLLGVTVTELLMCRRMEQDNAYFGFIIKGRQFFLYEKAEIEPECGAQSHGYAQSHRDAPGSVGKP